VEFILKNYFKSIICFCVILFSVDSYAIKVYQFDGASLSAGDKLTVLALAGIVNRDTARVYLKNVRSNWSYPEADSYQWIENYKTHGGATFETISGLSNLINKFKSRLSGAVVYDNSKSFGNFSGQSFLWQGEFAAMLGGLTNRIPLTSTQAASYGLDVKDSILINDAFDGNSPAYFSVKLNNSWLPWNNSALSNEEQYLKLLEMGVRKVLPLCNPLQIANRELNDFYVSKRMFHLNLGATTPDGLDFNELPDARAQIIEDCLVYLKNRNPDKIKHFYGWINPEPLVQWISAYGFSFHETLVPNMSFHASYPVINLPTSFKPAAATLTNDEMILDDKYYVVVVGTEGDAANWVNTMQSGAWLSAKRGQIPVNWGWSLHLLEQCPFLAYYYYKTATKNDGFVSVTTPLGYAYPDVFPDQMRNDAVNQSKGLFAKYGINNVYAYKHYCGEGSVNYRGVTISNNFNFIKLGNFQKDINANLTMVFDPLLYNQQPSINFGSLMFNHCPAWNSGEPTTFYAQTYSGNNDVTIFSDRIINYLQNKPTPNFLIGGYQRLRKDAFSSRVDPSDADISLPMLEQVYNKVKADPNIGSKVEFVTVERFTYLLRKKLNLPSGISPSNQVMENDLALNCYPNPFNPATTINYQLTMDNVTMLSVYNAKGELVKSLANGMQKAGSHSVSFDGSMLNSGVYFVRLIAGNSVRSQKILLVK